ncbi:MAG: hypothetical protein IKO80_04885 [Lachnospiraceae bacterium]|nr:hypothetical protein [Lachnospiraceae bacterium]
MILRKTGDALEHSDTLSRILTVMIVILSLLLAVSVLACFARVNNSSRREREIWPVDKLDWQLSYYGWYRGLDTVLTGPYPFSEDPAYRTRWACSEYYAERFLEEIHAHNGDVSAASAAHTRAAHWLEQTGDLSVTEEIDGSLKREVWP